MKKAEVTKKTLDIEEVKPHPKNPKDHWEKGLRDSIDEMGYIEPIVVDENSQLLAGHGRIKILKEQGYKEVDAIVVEGLTKKQKEKYLLMSNKIGERGGWKDDLLAEIDRDILSEAGFDDTEISGILDDDEAYTKKIIPPVYEPKNKKPDIRDLRDKEKTIGLLEEIRESGLGKEEKEFLEDAAQRLIVFNYKRIADYYSHSEGEMQDLMEKLALVIIDYDKAIEEGFVKVNQDLLNLIPEGE